MTEKIKNKTNRFAYVSLVIQNQFLEEAKNRGFTVSVSLRDGGKIEGRVKAFDTYTILFEDNLGESLLFKAACSQIKKVSGAKSRKLRRVNVHQEG